PPLTPRKFWGRMWIERPVKNPWPIKTPIKAKAANEDRDDIMQAEAPQGATQPPACLSASRPHHGTVQPAGAARVLPVIGI
ncbi:MAG: hypothetical protein VXW58_01225, partial [Pseudomonadota bacterium]|nr:hypothetical protein [Pseudomonadota bacterium]